MSLDVYLTIPGRQAESREKIFIREGGKNKEISREEWGDRYPGREPVTVTTSDGEEVYSDNITHNLNLMAKEAGVYKPCWRPDEIGVTKAHQLIPMLSDGYLRLRNRPELFRKFNPTNGWGDYEGLLAFVKNYLIACINYHDADVSVSR